MQTDKAAAAPALRPLRATRAHRRPLRRPARGLVTVLVMLLLIGVVLSGLTMLLNTETGHHAQTVRQGDNERVLFVAESGLEAAQARLAELLGANFTQAGCTGLASHFGTTTVGDGAFTVSATSTPTTCSNNGGTPCAECSVTVNAQVGTARRTLSQGIGLALTPGTTCNATAGQSCANTPPPSWKLNLINNHADAAVAVFSLAARRSAGSSGALCTDPACRLEWTINARNGNNSLGSIGNAVPVASGASHLIYQQFDADYDLAEVGALFPGRAPGIAASLAGRTASGVPVPGGAAYWEEVNNGSGGTMGRSTDFTGITNNGAATDPATDTCTTTPVPGNKQLCTNWCYGGNTLVMGLAADATTAADALTSVSFGTDAGGQAVPLARIAKYPTASTPNAPATLYTELWYAQNPDYLSTNTARNGASFTGYAGVHFTAGFSNNSNLMAVSGLLGGTLSVGQVVRCASGNCPAILNSGTVTILSQQSGTSGGTGNYRLSANCANPRCTNNIAAGITSTRLTVTAVANGQLSVGDVVSSSGTAPNITVGTTLTAVPGGGSSSSATGNYTLSSAQLVTSRTMSATGTTITLTSGTTVPLAGTLLAVRAGTGTLQAQTRVLASPAPTATSFKVDKVPATALAGATLCGGTCAFFRHGSATTQFTLAKSAGTGFWGAGFMCLKDAGVPDVVNSAITSTTRWTELVVN